MPRGKEIVPLVGGAALDMALGDKYKSLQISNLILT